MLHIKDIIEGHTNELFGLLEELSKTRLKICYKCPLYSTNLGGQCNGNLWLNPETGDVSTTMKNNYYKGCGCRLLAKTRVPTAVCPVGKW